MSVEIKAAKEIVKALQSELEQQGHVATGAGLASIYEKVTKIPDGFNIQIFGLAYLMDLNDGVDPKDLPAVEQLKSDLADWMEIKNIPSEALYPILNAILQEGIPTSGSYVHSQNGRRLGFVDHVKEQVVPSIIDKLKREIALLVRSDLIEIIREKVA